MFFFFSTGSFVGIAYIDAGLTIAVKNNAIKASATSELSDRISRNLLNHLFTASFSPIVFATGVGILHLKLKRPLGFIPAVAVFLLFILISSFTLLSRLLTKRFAFVLERLYLMPENDV